MSDSPTGKTNLELSHDVANLTARVDKSMDHIATELGGLGERIEEVDNLSRSEVKQVRAVVVEHIDRLIALEEVPPQECTELYKSLIAAQLEIRNAEALVDNEFTKKKYADLASVMDAVREPLAKNGLAIIQTTATVAEVATVDQSGHAIGIKTTLIHSSGQTIVDITAMVPEKITPQGIGSCRTYMRRYAVLAICAIAGAIDDDAEGASKGGDDYPRITTKEVEKIVYAADELFGERADAAVNKMLRNVFGGAAVVGDIREGEAETALTALANSKKLMDKTAAAAKKQEAADKKAAEEK